MIVNFGIDYSNGRYGSQTRTETWAIPMSLKYRTDRWNLRVSTSFLSVQGDGVVTPDGDPLNGGGDTQRIEGMGDITTGLTYALLSERQFPVGVDIGAKIKFGTADTDKSLGTGENDFTLKTEFYKSFGRWAPYLTLGYKWKGDPDTIEYRNVWLGSVGTNYRLSPILSLGGSYDWQQSVISSGNPVSEASLYLSYKLDTKNKLNLYVLGGFSDASPDWGSGLTYSRTF